MLKKINGMKIELSVAKPKENEKLCDACGGTGWLLNDKTGTIQMCLNCYSGVVKLCSICGSPKNGICTNKKCTEERGRISELVKIEKAKHYTLDTCPRESCEMFYSNFYGYNKGYFTEIEDLESYLFDSGNEMPNHIWGTKKHNVTLDAYGIVSDALEESHEDAFDSVDRKELSKLQKACDDFINAHGSSFDIFSVDYDVCIDL